MIRNIQQRVRRTLEDSASNSEEAARLVDWLRDALRDNSEGVRRSVTFYFLTVLAFELVLTANITEVTVAGAKLEKLPSLLVFAPSVATYFFLETVILSTRNADLHIALREAMGLWRTASSGNDLDILVRPRIALFWPIGTGPRALNRTRLRGYEWWLFVAFLIGAVLLELAFAIQAFAVLLSLEAPQRPPEFLIWINVGLTIGLMAVCAPYLSYFTFWRELRQRVRERVGELFLGRKEDMHSSTPREGT